MSKLKLIKTKLIITMTVGTVLLVVLWSCFLDYQHRFSCGRVGKCRVERQIILTALQMYKLDNGYYPSVEQGLEALTTKPISGNIPENYPKTGGLTITPLDPWGTHYRYRIMNNEPIVDSAGPDLLFNTGDDINKSKPIRNQPFGCCPFSS